MWYANFFMLIAQKDDMRLEVNRFFCGVRHYSMIAIIGLYRFEYLKKSRQSSVFNVEKKKLHYLLIPASLSLTWFDQARKKRTLLIVI